MIDDLYCLLSNDVETTSIWFNSLNDETGLKVLKEGMPALLDLYSKYGIKSTFFFTGYIAALYPEIVKMVLPHGHEVASHGKSHARENGFDIMPFERQKRHLLESKKILQDLSGQEVISFRAPALRTNHHTPRALIEAGYKIDSSIASQRFDFFLSFGGVRKLKWLFAPRLPYRTSAKTLYRKGSGPIVEVPLSALFFPYVGTTMRIFPRLTSMQRRIGHMEARMSGKPVVFDIHPNELIDETSQPRVICARTTNPLTSLAQDWLRAKLKAKNLGPQAIAIYEKEVAFHFNRKYKFVTIKDYCAIKGLL
jgi:peptidoglycan-N-acetylglucosamine deacetylase